MGDIMKELLLAQTKLRPVEHTPRPRRASTGSSSRYTPLDDEGGSSSIEVQLHMELEKAMRKRRGHTAPYTALGSAGEDGESDADGHESSQHDRDWI